MKITREIISYLIYLLNRNKYYLFIALLFILSHTVKLCAPKNRVIYTYKLEDVKKPNRKSKSIKLYHKTNLCFQNIKPKKLSKKDEIFILSITENASLADKYKLYRLVYQTYYYLTKNNLLAEVFATQFVLESFYGSTTTGTFNYGGIKEFNNTNRTLCRTTEVNCSYNDILNYKRNKCYYGSVTYRTHTVHYVADYFKNFNSLEEYLLYKINLIKNDDNYKKYKCWDSKTINQYCHRITQAGYATDIEYSNKIKAIIKFWNEYSQSINNTKP